MGHTGRSVTTSRSSFRDVPFIATLSRSTSLSRQQEPSRARVVRGFEGASLRRESNPPATSRLGAGRARYAVMRICDLYRIGLKVSTSFVNEGLSCMRRVYA